jgi:hypothetical protein
MKMDEAASSALRKAFRGDVGEAEAEWKKGDCPAPERWVAVALRLASWTAAEAAHVAGCPHCRRHQQEWEPAGETLRASVGVASPSAPATSQVAAGTLLALIARRPPRPAVVYARGGERKAAEWELAGAAGEPVPLPPAVARRCYGVAEQSVTLRLGRVPVPGARGAFQPQLEVSPPPSQAPLTFQVTFAGGHQRILEVPMPQDPRASSRPVEPLPAEAFGADEWPVTLEVWEAG